MSSNFSIIHCDIFCTRSINIIYTSQFVNKLTGNIVSANLYKCKRFSSPFLLAFWFSASAFFYFALSFLEIICFIFSLFRMSHLHGIHDNILRNSPFKSILYVIIQCDKKSVQYIYFMCGERGRARRMSFTSAHQNSFNST